MCSYTKAFYLDRCMAAACRYFCKLGSIGHIQRVHIQRGSPPVHERRLHYGEGRQRLRQLLRQPRRRLLPPKRRARKSIVAVRACGARMLTVADGSCLR